MNAGFWFAALLFCIGVVLFVCYSRTGKMLRCILFTALSGAIAMGLLWVVGRFINIGLALTPFSLLASLLLGVPGVLAMLLLLII